MRTYVTVGLAVVAGAALLETALIPGLLIGGVAVLAGAGSLAYRRKVTRNR